MAQSSPYVMRLAVRWKGVSLNYKAVERGEIAKREHEMEGPDSMNAGRGRIGLRKLGVARIGKAQNRLKIAMWPNCAAEWIIPVLPLLFGRVEREKDRPNGTTPPGLNNSGTSVVREVPEGKGLGEMNRPLPLASQEPQSNKSPLSLAWRHLKVEDDGRKGRRAAHPLQGIDACQHRLDLSAGLRVETGLGKMDKIKSVNRSSDFVMAEDRRDFPLYTTYASGQCPWN
nr:hypothetical protein B23L21.240 [imported] - Neurospora crassa [Neurospora crassa]